MRGEPAPMHIIDAPSRRHPQEDTMGQMKEFAGVYYREGALDPKTMQLVALAAMAAAGCTS
jgi:alkylhydroperoxidase/carboxymuconolactone decarboxylase family protein YurZ